MSVADETINMRTKREQKERLRRAAELERVPLTAFVLSAADEKADWVFHKHNSLSVPADFYDEFFDSLSTPAKPSRALLDLAQQPRRFKRR